MATAEERLARANECYWAGDLTGLLTELELAHAEAERAGQPQLAAGAALALLGYQKQFVGNDAAARGWLAHAARIVETEAPELQGELLGARAFLANDPADAERFARAAVEIGRTSGKPDLEILAMTALGAALVQQGRTFEGVELLDEAMAGAFGGRCTDLVSVAHDGCMTMTVCASYFDLERARHWVDAMDGFVAEHGCPFLDADCRTSYGRVLFESGDWSAAEAFLEQAATMSEGRLPAALASAIGTLAELRMAQGRSSEAADMLAPLVGRAEALAADAELCLARGDHALAAARLSRRLDEVGTDRLDVVRLVELLGDCELAGGRDARPLAHRLLKLAAAHACDLAGAHGHRLLGHSLQRSDPRAAQVEYERALAAFTRCGSRFRAAQTRLSLSAVLAITDPGAAPGEKAAAYAQLAAMGAAVPGTPVRRLDGLSPREGEVLDLLADGLSNPEIADRLVVSRRTVDHHVSHIFTKLGFSSRTQAVAYAIRRPLGPAAE